MLGSTPTAPTRQRELLLRTGLFGRLPNKLLSHILNILPIHDVLSLKAATGDCLAAVRRRMDPCQYLEEKGPFVHPRRLFHTISINGGGVSGSRGLDWFLPGSATEASDWDIYIPAVLSAIIAVKAALEQSGVCFETCLAQAALRLHENRSVFLTRRQILSIAHEAQTSPSVLWTDDEFTILKAIYNTYPGLRNTSRIQLGRPLNSTAIKVKSITIKRDGSVSHNQFHVYHSYSNEEKNYGSVSPMVISGTAERNNRKTRVQLVVGAIDPRKQFLFEPSSVFHTVFRSIFRFYGSHVMCFLSEYAAVHMYYKLAVERKAYRWRVPENIRKRADAGVQKYEHRGFQFFRTPEDDGLWTYRNVLDSDAIFLQLDNDERYRAPIEMIKKMEWTHSGDIICPATRPIVAGWNELLRFGIVDLNFDFIDQVRRP
jgi:hypothetical protein